MISLQLAEGADSTGTAAGAIFARDTHVVAMAARMEAAGAIGPSNIPSRASSNAASVDISDHVRFSKWSPYLETVFQELVAKRANGSLTPEDQKKLKRIRSERQRLKNPLSSDVMLWDFKAQQLRTKALGALKEYVEFLEEAPRRS